MPIPKRRRPLYKAHIESKRSAKRWRYEEGLEENRAAQTTQRRRYEEPRGAAKMRRYEEDLEENRAAKRRRYEEDLEGNRAAKTRIIQLPLKHLKGVHIGMTLLSDWLNPKVCYGMLYKHVFTCKECMVTQLCVQ